MRDTIDMAREAGCIPVRHPEYDNDVQVFATPDVLKAFEALVRADEREEANRRANASWSLMCEKMVAAEREACAKLAEDIYNRGFGHCGDAADAIRERSSEH